MRLTLQQVNNLDGYKPRCRFCHAGCDPKSREYKGMQLCPPCYRDCSLKDTFTVKKKELLPCRKN
jgi:hypothetical protein